MILLNATGIYMFTNYPGQPAGLYVGRQRYWVYFGYEIPPDGYWALALRNYIPEVWNQLQ